MGLGGIYLETLYVPAWKLVPMVCESNATGVSTAAGNTSMFSLSPAFGAGGHCETLGESGFWRALLGIRPLRSCGTGFEPSFDCRPMMSVTDSCTPRPPFQGTPT